MENFAVRSGFIKVALACFLLVAMCFNTAFGYSNEIALQELPKQGRETYQLIHQGGPFPFDKDGTVFGNRERLLPGAKRGYYREYTVKTPGSRTRGARRIVCGGAASKPDACYYTDDHYASFRKIAP